MNYLWENRKTCPFCDVLPELEIAGCEMILVCNNDDCDINPQTYGYGRAHKTKDEIINELVPAWNKRPKSEKSTDSAFAVGFNLGKERGKEEK